MSPVLISAREGEIGKKEEEKKNEMKEANNVCTSD